MQTFKLPTSKFRNLQFSKAFTKGIYKNEVQCKIKMQIRMSKLGLGKKKSCNQKMKKKTQKLKQKKTNLNKTKNINKNLQKNTNNKTFE